MTLIALHAEKHRATIMTDTWGYTFDCSMSTTSKHTVIPHLDMAMAAQGSTGFQSRWLATLLMLSDGRITSFDDLLAASPDLLRTVWAGMSRDVAAEIEETGARTVVAKTIIFHVGYSHARDSFVAHAYASEQDFQPIDLTDVPYTQPTPLSNKPGPIEGPRLLRHFADNGIPLDALDALDRMPALGPPQNEAEWVDLAERIRVDRSECDLFSGFKTYVGGDVHLTTLTPGSAHTRCVHRYADDNETLRKVFAGSLHPLSQLGPCALCDSGRTFVECCLGSHYNGRPCPCGSPDNFDECCSALAHHRGGETAVSDLEAPSAPADARVG